MWNQIEICLKLEGDVQLAVRRALSDLNFCTRKNFSVDQDHRFLFSSGFPPITWFQLRSIKTHLKCYHINFMSEIQHDQGDRELPPLFFS